MLRLHYGVAGRTLLNIKEYFLNVYEPQWLTTDISKRIILGIDKSEVVSPYLIQSPVLGPIGPDMLSDGALGVILMLYDASKKNCDWIGEYFGDNTLPYILEVSQMVDYDIRMSCDHLFIFPDEFEQGVYLEDTDRIIYTQKMFSRDFVTTGRRIFDAILAAEDEEDDTEVVPNYTPEEKVNVERKLYKKYGDAIYLDSRFKKNGVFVDPYETAGV